MEDFHLLVNKLIDAPQLPPVSASAQVPTAAPSQAAPTSPAESIQVQTIYEEVSRNLMLFTSETVKLQRVGIAEKLQKKAMNSNITFTPDLFHSLIEIYTESQHWKQVLELLQMVSPKNCQPNQKTLRYIKKNMVYCFDNNLRGALKEATDNFDQTFFTKFTELKEREMQMQNRE